MEGRGDRARYGPSPVSGTAVHLGRGRRDRPGDRHVLLRACNRERATPVRQDRFKFREDDPELSAPPSRRRAALRPDGVVSRPARQGRGHEVPGVFPEVGRLPVERADRAHAEGQGQHLHAVRERLAHAAVRPGRGRGPRLPGRSDRHRRGVEPDRRAGQDPAGRFRADDHHQAEAHRSSAADPGHLDRGRYHVHVLQPAAGPVPFRGHAETVGVLRLGHPGRRGSARPRRGRPLSSRSRPPVRPRAVARFHGRVQERRRVRRGRLGASVRQPARHGHHGPVHQREPVGAYRTPGPVDARIVPGIGCPVLRRVRDDRRDPHVCLAGVQAGWRDRHPARRDHARHRRRRHADP